MLILMTLYVLEYMARQKKCLTVGSGPFVQQIDTSETVSKIDIVD